MTSSQDPRFSFGSIEEGRKLAIKLWNVSRLILQNAGDERPELRPRELVERWVLARLDAGRAELGELLGRYDFAAAVRLLYRLTFDDFCDWYAEAIKPRLYDGDADARATAFAALERLLKLLHPVMPHVTEEIWSQFHDDRLIVAPWPESDERWTEAVDALDRVKEEVALFRRHVIDETNLDGDEGRIFKAVAGKRSVARSHELPFTVHSRETERLQREIERAQRMLGNQAFVDKAPEEVVQRERDKLKQYERELKALLSR
jgi:valyl-tRNA synthetase